MLRIAIFSPTSNETSIWQPREKQVREPRWPWACSVFALLVYSHTYG
jgi:hypothetical protein